MIFRLESQGKYYYKLNNSKIMIYMELYLAELLITYLIYEKIIIN
jgi:hypothetical protein